MISDMGQLNELLTYQEVMDYLKISEASLLRAIADEENPLKVTYLGDKTPRIKLEDLTVWIDEQDKKFKTKKEQNNEK